MPQMRKLAIEEVQALENKGKGQRKLVEEQFDAILGEYTIGEYGEATLDPGENRLTVRNRLRAAAGRRHFGIHFKRTSGDLVRFQIVDHAAPASEPAPASGATAPKKRGGRPKKVV